MPALIFRALETPTRATQDKERFMELRVKAFEGYFGPAGT